MNPNSNIRMTPNAVIHIKNMLQDQEQEQEQDQAQGELHKNTAYVSSSGIRLGVKASGCSGLSYILDFIKDERPDDLELTLDGIRVLIDSQSLRYLQGMEIDCIQDGLNRYLKFNNPNVKGECGCGESFTVDADN